MAYIHNLLELNPRHLPQPLVDTLTDPIGLRVESTAFGTLIAVPDPGRLTGSLLQEVARVLSYARDLDCDYILVDAGFELDDDLPVFDD
jgi:hypothetical protein